MGVAFFSLRLMTCIPSQFQTMVCPPILPNAFTEPRPRGQLGRAWRQLRAPPPLPAGAKQWEAAREKLFPHGSTEGPPLREDSTPHHWQPTIQQFNKALHRLKRQKAPDAGGWTTESAQSCLDDPRTKQRILQWITGQAGSIGTYTGREGLVHFHKLICLDKGNGGVRPILIGMLWTKLLSHLLLAQARPDLDVHLKDRQYGIGTPQGGLAMTMAIRARLQENPDHVIAAWTSRMPSAPSSGTTV